MSNQPDHAPWGDDLAAYALGALEPAEAAEFEGHLVDCERCRAELVRLTPAVEGLSTSVPRLEPPPGLRKRIMDVVEAEAAVGTQVGSATASPRRSRRWSWAWRPAPIAALATAIAIAFIAGFGLRGGDDATRTVTAQALTDTAVSAALVEHDGDWHLQVDKLPEPPADHVYEIWVQRGADVKPSSLFVLSRDGRAQVPLPETLREGDKVMVTVEPAGGSAKPSSDPLLQAQV
jgi:anti-sigma-K factor RskA